MTLINIDFTQFLKLNTIYKLKIKKNKEFESNFMSSIFSEIYENSIKNPEKFWQEASVDIFWFKKPTKFLNKSNPPFYKWFGDGVTNSCYNALDFHVDQGRGEKTALIYDSPITGSKTKFTFNELRQKVSKFNIFRKNYKIYRKIKSTNKKY